ncbi:2-iminobutanoate/2-iminopropanoate deaminase [Olsenella profusa DSM 13989]|uniref:RidA family protein n=1 Tax=Olsenella profusa TaxID=138595 RepID=UPI0027819F95|nr:RidA family protein [Olsenella profusa]MDP9860495.1 2-iminobutanoate/2-iminopropanoate deaminase [Olsenella profusa DSM 13989]
MAKRIATDGAPAAIGPYSQAIKVGKTLYVSGMMPIDPETGAFAGTTIEAQAEQIMKNIGSVLREAGFGFQDVVKATCFLSDMNDFAKFNEVYAGYFVSLPARSCVAVRQIPKGALAEVEVIAVKEQ